MHRREFIAGMMASLAGTAAVADAARSSIGARNVSLIRAGGNEDAYYRQIYEMILSNTLPPDSELELTLPSIRSRAFASLANLKSLTINGMTHMDAGYVFQDTPIETLILPELVSCTNFYAFGASKLTTLVVPSLSENMRYLCYIGTSALTDVYIDNATCSQILAIPNFPGMAANQNSNYANVVFHGSDGEVVYNGSSWVKA